LYYKACTKHFPVLLCTAKLAQSTSQYYFVLQSLHKVLPSTTLYYKAYTKHVPVLQSLHEVLPRVYYFVLRSLRKALPCTTLYYKAYTKHVPALLCTRKVAHNTSRNTSSFDTQQAFPESKLLHTASFCYTKNALTHSKLLHKESFYTSSTAQGGGGSFKNRKPIGEVGCCESWMAERSH